MKKTKDNTLIQKYRELKKEVQNQQRNAYWRYIEEIVTANENDQTSEGSKKFWTFNKHRKKENIGITSLQLEGKLFTDPTEKANIVNQQIKSAFSSKCVFSKEEYITTRGKQNKHKPQLNTIAITTN